MTGLGEGHHVLLGGQRSLWKEGMFGAVESAMQRSKGKSMLRGRKGVWELSLERQGCREGQCDWSILTGTVAGGKIHLPPDLPSTTYHPSAIICSRSWLLCWPGQLGPNPGDLFRLGAQPGGMVPPRSWVSIV